MKFANYILLIATLFALVLLGSGCSGISADGTVSPAMFLIPGFTTNDNGKPTHLENDNIDKKTLLEPKTPVQTQNALNQTAKMRLCNY
ncbi:MAG: hypothetical protein ACP5T0_13590 [Verrucomicrobiia bacterium]